MLSQELERLDELRRRGVLTDDEFARVKARLLDHGASTSSPNPFAALGQLRRSRSDRWIGGVCGGMARLTGTESWLWRLAFGLLFFLGGVGAVLYVLLWVFVPVE